MRFQIDDMEPIGVRRTQLAERGFAEDDRIPIRGPGGVHLDGFLRSHFLGSAAVGGNHVDFEKLPHCCSHKSNLLSIRRPLRHSCLQRGERELEPLAAVDLASP